MSIQNKIIAPNQISKIISNVKTLKKKIALVSGVFDLLHLGHIKYFKAAKKHADILILSLTDDKFVNKGIGRPYFKLHQRAEVLSSIKYIDYIIVSQDYNCLNVIRKVKPNYYVKGPDYKNLNLDITKNIIKEKKLTEKLGGKLLFVNEETFSSSTLLNMDNVLFNDKQKKFINSIKRKYSFSDVKKYLNKFKNNKVYCIGEIIIDKYTFCETLGKSGKDPHLVLDKKKEEIYLGGSAAIARQLSEFGSNVTLLSFVGEEKEYLNFIKKNIGKDIKLKLIFKKGSSSIVKERFLDQLSNNKLFGVYEFNDNLLNKSQEKFLIKIFKNSLTKKDSVLVADYDHGLISSNFAKILEKQKKIFLNTQINASNLGFHNLKKFKNINTLVINEKELRHEYRSRFDDLHKLAKRMILERNITNLIVTRGSSGSLYAFKRKNVIKIIECPSFAVNVLDKIGAGDTMLAIICLCIKNKVPNDLSIFLGSLIGAMSVQQYANKEPVKYENFLRTIEFTLK